MPNRAVHILTKRFCADEGGVVSVVGAFFLLLGLAIGVMVVDAGHLYLAKRRLQAAVDAAALAAAGDVAGAGPLAGRVLEAAGYTDSRRAVQAGVYRADPALAPAARFHADPSGAPNAVRVTQTISVPGFFTAVLHDGAPAGVTATATAAQTPIVSFSAGTGLAALDDGVVNQVLGGLFGVRLDIAGYQALADTNVDALAFLNSLAANAGVAAGTYGDLAATDIGVGQFIAAAQAQLNLHPGASSAAALDVLKLLSAEVPPGVAAPVGAVMDTTFWQTRKIGSVATLGDGGAVVNLFDMVSAIARVYGAGRLVGVDTAVPLGETGGRFSAKLVVGQQMQSAIGPVGTGVETAQARLAITVTQSDAALHVLGLPVLDLHIGLPLYLEVAAGAARVSAITCRTDADGSVATITAAPQAATLAIGQASAAALQDFARPVAVAPAPALSLTALGIAVANVGESGALSLDAGAPVPLYFTRAQIAAGAAQSVAGSDAGTLFSALGGVLAPTIQILPGTVLAGVLNAAAGPLTAQIQTDVAGLLGTLDPQIDTLLRTLGLRLGTMDVVVRGVDCGQPVLVD